MVKRLKLSEAVDLLDKAYGKPRTAEHADAPLLDHLLVGVLTAWVDRDRAVRALRALSESFLDLNEARVSPLAELQNVLHPFLGAKSEEAALALRIALQDVYDGTHGLDLEPLRGREPDDLRKFLRELPHAMGGPSAAIFQLALGDVHLPLITPIQRVLDRLRLLPHATTPHRVRLALEKHVKAATRLQFCWSIGSHASAVCTLKDPLCETCLLLSHCAFGDIEVKRREAERKKDALRVAAEEKRRQVAQAKAQRDAARKAAVEAKKKAIADAKAAKIAAAKAAAEKAAADKKAKIEADKKARIEAAKAAKAAKIEAVRAAKAAKKEKERAAAAAAKAKKKK